MARRKRVAGLAKSGSKRWHVWEGPGDPAPAEEMRALCDHRLRVLPATRDLADAPKPFRCKRQGCRQAWPSMYADVWSGDGDVGVSRVEVRRKRGGRRGG